ncbi:Bud site selection protein bud4, partial [Coemansia nantahalensis]
GKQPVRAAPEMQQIQAPDSLPHMPATTVDELEADASTDEDSIPAILFVPSQEFEGYRPIGFEIRDYQDELRQEKRTQKAAAKRAAGQPGATASAAPRHDTYTRAGHRQRKRELEQSTISSRRLREELDATMADDDDAEQMSPSGTIKPLTKRARTGPVAGLFESPEAATGGTRQSFLGSVDIPVSELGEGEQPSGGYPPTERMEDMLVTQEFAADGQRQQHPAEYDPALMFGPRRRLVLRSNAKNFSERVMEEINGLNVNVRTDVHGAVNVRSAGQFAYAPPAGTVRPSTLPDYVSPLNGVPAGPFFMPPKAEVKSGYLYMRILSVEEMEGDPSSLYFVIRNGIDTLATTPVGIDGPGNTTINQEFRILTDPNVSITMWMRFRSDAIIHRGIRSGRGMLGEPGCVPPLLRRLVRRNTRSRSRRWQCQGPPDSVFDFDGSQSRFAPGARRAGPPSRGGSDLYPARTSSQSGRAYRAGTQPSHGGHNDPRSLNATQAPSSVFYEPGAEMVRPSSSNKGLAQARFREETRGVAVVHVGEMIEEVFLRGLVDSWDVENVWESRCGAQMNLQLFFIPECPLFREEELPRTLSECEMAMEVCAFHNRTLNSGYMSQRGGDTRFWRRRYFRLIGGFLFAYHEESKEPRCFIDLNDATRVVDVQPERGPRAAGMGGQLSTMDLMRSQRMRRPRRPGSHQRNRSDASLRGRDMAAAAHEYASDSEPAEAVDLADPHLQRATPRRPRPADGAAMSPATDSGIVSGASTDDAPDNGMQHSFAIEFGAGGLIEFYTQTEKEKRLWVEIIKRVVGRIPKIPSWLIKLLHADVSDRIDGSGQLGSDPSLGNISTPSSRFEELTHPHPHLRA